MIDFRYHLVSIIAIFFALAAGIVLGAGPLGDEADKNLSDQVNSLRQQADELREERDLIQAQSEAQIRYVNETAPRLIDGALAGQNVAIVSLPGAAEDQVDAIIEAVEDAGAITDVRVRIEPAWADTEAEATLDDLASQHASSDVKLDEDSDGYGRAAQVLAAAVMTQVSSESSSGDVGPPTFPPLETDVIGDFESAGYMTLVGDSSSKATLAVFVSGPLSGDDASDRVGRLIPLSEQFDAAGDGTVVAGPASTADEGGVIASIRGGDESDTVSTVDTVTNTAGRVGVVLAASEQLKGGVGMYGQQDGSDRLVPPVPEEGE